MHFRPVPFIVAGGICMAAPSVSQTPQAYTPGHVANGGTISGRVTFTGAVSAPEQLAVTTDAEACNQEPIYSEELVVGRDQGVKNVVVWIDDVNEGKPWADSGDDPILNQLGCRFNPHVIIVRAGVPFYVLNSDGILHNIHTRGEANRPVNKAHPKILSRLRLQIRNPEIVRLECDVHDWMSGWIVVTAHPYYVATDENGVFTLEDVPPGTYTLQFWHEQLGTQTKQATVLANGTVEVNVVLSSDE